MVSIATHIQPKDDALAFGVFGGVAFIGFLLSLGIRGEGIEAEGWDEEEGSEDDDDDDDEEEEDPPR